MTRGNTKFKLHMRNLEDAADFLLNSKKYKTAFALYKLGWELGSEHMLLSYADCLYHGTGTRKNISAALPLLRKAAGLGIPEAATALGVHAFKQRKPSSLRVALTYYRAAAISGEPNSIHNLGLCYFNGTGVKKDIRVAFKHFLRAAKLKHTESQFKTGFCYMNGDGVRKNAVAGRKWLKLAIAGGHREAKNYL